MPGSKELFCYKDTTSKGTFVTVFQLLQSKSLDNHALRLDLLRRCIPPSLSQSEHLIFLQNKY